MNESIFVTILSPNTKLFMRAEMSMNLSDESRNLMNIHQDFVGILIIPLQNICHIHEEGEWL